MLLNHGIFHNFVTSLTLDVSHVFIADPAMVFEIKDADKSLAYGTEYLAVLTVR